MSGNNVDIPEVEAFSDDLQEASTDIRSQLDKVKESIETINGMSSFSGKAAKEAKTYFGELHLTILESFRGLFDDLEENLKQHLDTFESEVDSSGSAVIRSNYLQDIKEEVNDVFADLEKQDESISDTIQDVSDISSATPPSFSDVDEWKKKAIKKLEELDEDLDSFTGEGDETDVKAIMDKIETAMSNAKTSEGKARFADFEGASQMKELAKLQDYNEDKQEERKEELEKAKDARDSALQDQDKSSSQDVINKVYQEYKNGDTTYDQYKDILDSVQNTSGNMGEELLKEETTEDFIKYLEDRGMLDQYLDDHKHLGEFLAEKTPETLKNVGEAITAKIIEKSGSGMKNLGDRISDKRFLQDLGQSLLKNGKGIQFVGKALGPVFTAGEGIYGTYDDMSNNDKTFGEAITHNATTTAVGVGVAAGILTVASGGIAVVGAAAAGAILAKATDFAYQKDFLGIKTNLDKAGHWIDDTADRAKESFSFVKDHPGEAFKAGLKSINPVAGLF